MPERVLYNEFVAGDEIYYENATWGREGKVVKVYPSGWVLIELKPYLTLYPKVVKQSSLRKL